MEKPTKEEISVRGAIYVLAAFLLIIVGGFAKNADDKAKARKLKESETAKQIQRARFAPKFENADSLERAEYSEIY